MAKTGAFLVSVFLLGLFISGCTQTAGPSPTVLLAPTATTVPATGTPVRLDTPMLPTDTSTPRETETSTEMAKPSPAPSTQTSTASPSETLEPTPSLTPAPTASSTLPSEPDAAVGQQLWPGLVCSACHGQQAQGNIGPKLAGTGLSIDQVRATVRLGKGQMPAIDEATITDVELGHVYAWLRSMAPPTPTAIAQPTFPTQSLSDLWYYVNEMRIRADFAKDLPVRVASDEGGRLQVVKEYSGDGLNQVEWVLAYANQALGEVSDEGVQAIIREIISETNEVSQRFNRALAAGSYAQAWSEVAAAVSLCRLDTLPWATQAVRDAGLVGRTRVRVVDQSGQPIAGAFVTALTAHSPLAGRTNSSGRATFVNVAAVPALPVKAYTQGRVYHEVNFNVSPGAVAEGTIALPVLSGGTVAPSVSNASISPSAGPGDANVTFALDATDPQGGLDLAEDQIFALNADLGVAYVLLQVGGSHYEVRLTLPALAPGVHTWSFFAVDHECNTSNIIDVRYKVQ